MKADPSRSVGRIADVPEAVGTSTYPPEYTPRIAGRRKAQLGDAVGLDQFGVNRTVLEPGACSALRHWHTGEDEFVLVLEGEVVLVDDEGEVTLGPGDFAGFRAGVPNGHQLVNRGAANVVLIEVGSRRPGADRAYYPDDPLEPVDR